MVRLALFGPYFSILGLLSSETKATQEAEPRRRLTFDYRRQLTQGNTTAAFSTPSSGLQSSGSGHIRTTKIQSLPTSTSSSGAITETPITETPIIGTPITSATSVNSTPENSTLAGAVVSTVTKTENGQVVTVPVIVGGIFGTSVTLPSPDPTPLDPKGNLATSSAEAISSTYAAILPVVTSWLENKNQAEATSILHSLEGVPIIIGGMINNLPNGAKSLGGGCHGAKSRRAYALEGDSVLTFSSLLQGDLGKSAKRFFHGSPVIRRDLLGGLLGGLNNLLCSTSTLINSFTKITKTIDPTVIDGQASVIQATIKNINPNQILDLVKNGDNEQQTDRDKDHSSTKSTSTTTSSTSSSSTCTQMATATYMSVFCTVTSTASAALQRRDCSSLVYSMITDCSVTNTAATTTTTVIVTPSAVPDVGCSPGGCGSSDCAGTKLKKRAYRDAPKRDRRSPVAVGNWAEPNNYRSGLVSDFFRGEVARASRNPASDGSTYAFLDLNGFTGRITSTSLYEVWGDQVVTMALGGLYGCTSVVVISNRGAWISHFYETGPFLGNIVQPLRYDRQSGKMLPPVYESASSRQATFEEYVLGYLEYQLGALRNAYFSPGDDVRVLIVSPRTAPYQYKYLAQITDMSRTIRNTLGITPAVSGYDITPSTPSYSRVYNNEAEAVNTWRDWKREVVDATGLRVNGKILIQYRPAPSWHCNSRAEYRVFVEGQQIQAMSNSWVPLSQNQVVRQGGNQKRQECTLSKATTSGPNSTVANPNGTPTITGITTEEMKTSISSTTTNMTTQEVTTPASSTITQAPSTSEPPPYCTIFIDRLESISQCRCTDKKTFKLATGVSTPCPLSSLNNSWTEITSAPSSKTTQDPVLTTNAMGDVVLCTSFSKIAGVPSATACIGPTVSTKIAYATGVCKAHMHEYGDKDGFQPDVQLYDDKDAVIGNNTNEIPSTWTPKPWGQSVRVGSMLRDVMSLDFLTSNLKKRGEDFAMWDVKFTVGKTAWSLNTLSEDSQLPRCEVMGWMNPKDMYPADMPFPIPKDDPSFSWRNVTCYWSC